MTLARLAARLAFSKDPRQRWRQVSIVASSAVAAALLLLGLAVVHVAHISEQRIIARSPIQAATPDRAALRVSTRALQIEGRRDLGQFPVTWLEPVPGHEDDRRAVPPGLSALPSPGEGVLSPGLVERGFTAEDFGLTTSNVGSGPHGTIGPSGLVTASEGWIYARPAHGRSLEGSGWVFLIERYPSPSDRGSDSLNQETVPEVPTTTSALVGMLWLIVAPLLFLSLGAARSLSALRLQRSDTLFRLGIAPWRIRALLALETMALTGPGTAVGAGLWFVVGQGMVEVPMTGVRLLPGALTIGWAQVAAAVVALAALIGVAGTVGPLEARAKRARRRTPRSWQVVPIAAAVGLMALSRLATPMSPAAAYLLFGGVILSVASFPLALPVLAAATGRALARSRQPARWLAGRRLTFDPVALARPAAAVAALVLIAGAAFAIYDRITADPDGPDLSASLRGRVGSVDWRDERPSDVAWARERLSGMVTAPTGQGPGGEPVARVDDCRAAALALSASEESWCGPSGHFSVLGREQFSAATHHTPVTATDRTTLNTYSLLILSNRPIDQREVMQALAPRLPAVNVSGNGSSAPYIPIGWLIAGWVLASLVLAAAVIREIGDRALAALTSDSASRALGLRPRELGSVHRWAILTPIAVALPVGYTAAVVFALYGNYLGFTLYYLGRITLVSSAVALMTVLTLLAVFEIHRRTSSNA